MQSTNTMFDDLAKVMTGAAGTFAGAAKEFEGQMRERTREWLGGEDAVKRDEFEALRALAARAMGDVELLKARIATLEAAHAAGSAHASAPAAAPTAMPAATSPAAAGHAPNAAEARGGAGPDGTFTG